MKTKYDDLIILYLDNRMSGGDRTKFEMDLQNSPELYERFNQIKVNLKIINSGSSPETDADYFNDLLPQFRQKHEQNRGRKRLFPGYAAFASGLGVVVLLFFVLLFNSDIDKDGVNELADLNYTEADEVLDSYRFPDDLNLLYYDSGSELSEKIDSIFADQYMLAEGAGSYLEYNSVINSLSDEEADNIYAQLINKDIISGEL
jgi:hypothetical protein